MTSLKKHEGYLLIDDRASGGHMVEAGTYTCNHCQHIIVEVQQGLTRTTPREFCRGCGMYICQSCAATRAKTGECVPFAKIVDQVLSAAEKQTAAASPLILLHNR